MNPKIVIAKPRPGAAQQHITVPKLLPHKNTPLWPTPSKVSPPPFSPHHRHPRLNTKPSQTAVPSTAPEAPPKCSKPESSSDSDNPSLKPCISCKSVRYCSRDCKKADTKTHKKVCASLAQEYMKTADVKMASRSAPVKEAHRGGLQKWQFDT